MPTIIIVLLVIMTLGFSLFLYGYYNYQKKQNEEMQNQFTRRELKYRNYIKAETRLKNRQERKRKNKVKNSNS